MIPKIIHQIWLEEEMSSIMKEATNTIQYHNNGYKYYLWGLKDLKDFQLEYLIENNTPLVKIANILKFKLLGLFGGWAIDIDTGAMGSLDDIPTYLVASNIICNTEILQRTIEPQYGNSIIACEKYTDFDSLLSEYLKTSSLPMTNYWRNYCKTNKVKLIPYDFTSSNGTVILRNLNLKHWKKDMNNYNKQSDSHFNFNSAKELSETRDPNLFDLSYIKLKDEHENHIQTISSFYKKSYK